MEASSPASSFTLSAKWRRWMYVGVAMLSSFGVACACYSASGVSLGLFFGPMLLLAFLTPPLVAGENSMRGRLMICAAVALGTWCIWLFAASLGAIDLFRCGLVLGAFVLSMAGAVSLFECLLL